MVGPGCRGEKAETKGKYCCEEVHKLHIYQKPDSVAGSRCTSDSGKIKYEQDRTNSWIKGAVSLFQGMVAEEMSRRFVFKAQDKGWSEIRPENHATEFRGMAS